MLQGLEVWLIVSDALRELTGITQLPMDGSPFRSLVTPEFIVGVLDRLEEEVGPGYLIYGLFKPFNQALIGIEHQHLADAIYSESYSLSLNARQ